MGIKWDSFSEFEKRKFEKMSETDKFIYFLCRQFGSPYGWGKESPEAADCSGAVCMALFAATGLLIRTTADDLYKRVFTKPNPKTGDIRAVFFITKKDRRHGDRTAAAGTAAHVAGILDDGVILNPQEPCAKIRRLPEVSDWYRRNGYEVDTRGLDRDALARIAREGKTVHGLDAEFGKYFDIGGDNVRE
jgi:murein DD-endopeptidase